MPTASSKNTGLEARERLWLHVCSATAVLRSYLDPECGLSSFCRKSELSMSHASGK